ncbi:MAG: hypothetical protein JKY65_18250 [Planctomycetes bacterium]|nr:hypothetical protein [Planctomycetota bacterium]
MPHDDPDDLDDGIPQNEILQIDQLQALRKDNPAGLYRHLDALSQRFMFGIERYEGWGAPFRILLNRNIALHLVLGFNEDMPDASYLPQFSVFPSDDHPDTCDSTSLDVEGEEIRGLVFFLDPFDLDDLIRDAGRIAEDYPDWDLIPDSYFLDTDLIQWIGRVVLDEPRIVTEREFDFRLGFPGLKPSPIEDDEEVLTADDLMTLEESGDEISDEEIGDDESGEEEIGDDESDEYDEPLTGMRTVHGEWGGDGDSE